MNVFASNVLDMDVIAGDVIAVDIQAAVEIYGRREEGCRRLDLTNGCGAGGHPAFPLCNRNFGQNQQVRNATVLAL